MTEQTGHMAALSDSELVLRTRNGDQSAEEELVIRYGWLVRACARPLFLMGGDSEDLVQEGMLGLLAAIREFDPDRSVSFRTYAETCVRNRLRSAVKAASRDKHAPLNSYLPLDPEAFGDDGGEEHPALDGDPEAMLIHREDLRERMERINSQLSPLERKILRLYLDGLSYAEIAARCSRPIKSVDNAVQRIRRKVARMADDSALSARG